MSGKQSAKPRGVPETLRRLNREQARSHKVASYNAPSSLCITSSSKVRNSPNVAC